MLTISSTWPLPESAISRFLYTINASVSAKAYGAEMVFAENSAGSLNPSTWRLRKRVLPQHTDHAKVMWHGAYVAWLEEARVEALAESGLEYAVMTELGVEMPVVSLRIDYRRALMHGDFVTLESCCLERQGVRWPWCSRFLREGELMAEAFVELVMMRRGRLLRRPPPELVNAMHRLCHGESPQV